MSRRARSRPNKRTYDPRQTERAEQSAMDYAFEQLERERAKEKQRLTNEA